MKRSKKLFLILGILCSLQSLGITQEDEIKKETVSMSNLVLQEDISSAWQLQAINPSPYPGVPYPKIVDFPYANRQLDSQAPKKQRAAADYRPLQKMPQEHTEIILTRPPKPHTHLPKL